MGFIRVFILTIFFTHALFSHSVQANASSSSEESSESDEYTESEQSIESEEINESAEPYELGRSHGIEESDESLESDKFLQTTSKPIVAKKAAVTHISVGSNNTHIHKILELESVINDVSMKKSPNKKENSVKNPVGKSNEKNENSKPKQKQPKEITIPLPSYEACGVVHIKRTFDKVVGGKDAQIGAWPWIALLGYDFLTIEFLCGGALVTSRHVITAAHCVNDALTIVRLGEHDLSTNNETKHLDLNVTKIKMADFNETTGRNDLAILTLDKVVEFTDLISPICLPQAPIELTKSYVGLQPFVCGWGYTQESGRRATVLQELQTEVLNNEVCRDSFLENKQLKMADQFDESMLCVGEIAGGKDTCEGDSGGPLMMPRMINETMHYFLIGVVSQGIGCARKDLAGAYIRIPYFMDWIQKNLK